MEFLLLWADDLDDALGVLRHFASRLLALLATLALLCATGLALLLAPQLVLGLVAVTLCAFLAEFARRRLRSGRAHDR
jgi:hypothetical protein